MEDLASNILSILKDNPYTHILYIIIVISIIVALLVKLVIIPIYIYVYIPVRNFIKLVYGTLNKVDFLEKEMKPNGGSSLKDVVSRIENEVKTINLYLGKTQSKQEALFQFLGLGKDGLGFFESDKSGECIFVSQRYCEITGLLEEDALGMGWISSIHPDDRDRVYNEWKTCTNQHRAFILNYKLHNRRTNRAITVSCHAIPIRIGADILSYLGTIREIPNE